MGLLFFGNLLKITLGTWKPERQGPVENRHFVVKHVNRNFHHVCSQVILVPQSLKTWLCVLNINPSWEKGLLSMAGGWGQVFTQLAEGFNLRHLMTERDKKGAAEGALEDISLALALTGSVKMSSSHHWACGAYLGWLSRHFFLVCPAWFKGIYVLSSSATESLPFLCSWD